MGIFNIPFIKNHCIMAYNDNLGQQISNPTYDIDDAPEINADSMSEEELEKRLEEEFGIQEHNLNNGPEY